MAKLLLKNKLRNKMLETQRKFVENTQEVIAPDEGEHLLQYRQKHFKEGLSM